jgi:hypothetical protein
MRLPHGFDRLAWSGSCLAVCAVSACSGPQEAKRVELPVVTDGAGLEAVTTDLGYEVELSDARVVVDDLRFTVAGEVHASLWSRLSEAVIPVAHAHPGHFQGGEITGELPGHFVLRFSPGPSQALGTATLLVGSYRAVDFRLAQANSADVEARDPLVGHTALMRGTATQDSARIDFQVVVDSPEGRDVIGVPFEEEVDESMQSALVLRLTPLDSLDQDTLFDGVDFAALDADADGRVVIDPSATDEATVAAYNAVRRALQSHDHFVVQSLD